MTYRINLHAHSHNSDGRGTILELANKARELEFTALVVTDHDWLGAYDRSFAEIRTLEQHHLLPLPIILGAEIMTPFGECLLFGSNTIRRWFEHKHHLKTLLHFSYNLWVEAFKLYVLSEPYPLGGNWSLGLGPNTMERFKEQPHALVLCHPDYPALTTQTIHRWPKEFYQLLSGFEIQNGGRCHEVLMPDVIAELRNVIGPCRECRDSDAHKVDELGLAWNETEICITTETELLNWLNHGKLGTNRLVDAMQQLVQPEVERWIKLVHITTGTTLEEVVGPDFDRRAAQEMKRRFGRLIAKS